MIFRGRFCSNATSLRASEDANPSSPRFSSGSAMTLRAPRPPRSSSRAAQISASMYSHLATSSRAEAEVFAIDYADFPRMQFVWDAWFDFLLLTMGGPIFYSRGRRSSASARVAPSSWPGNEPKLFEIFAKEVGGLTNHQAEAMYWKDWFWTVREGPSTYPDEREPMDDSALCH